MDRCNDGNKVCGNIRYGVHRVPAVRNGEAQ